MIPGNVDKSGTVNSALGQAKTALSLSQRHEPKWGSIINPLKDRDRSRRAFSGTPRPVKLSGRGW
jgi:hypothetical protein